MSQHYILCERNGYRVRVTLGYDRRLDRYFLNVEQDGIDPDEPPFPSGQILNEQSVFYVSLYDLEAPYDDMNYFREKLRSFGIVVPESFFLAVEEDAIECVGNYVVEHFADGMMRVRLPKP